MRFTRLIPGDVCVQEEVMVKPIFVLAMIQHQVERIQKKNNLVIPKFQTLLLGKNCTKKT